LRKRVCVPFLMKIKIEGYWSWNFGIGLTFGVQNLKLNTEFLKLKFKVKIYLDRKFWFLISLLKFASYNKIRPR
jgi:hypothetical protein